MTNKYVPCDVCGKSFKNHRAMMSHRRYHDESFRKRMSESAKSMWTESHRERIAESSRRSELKLWRNHSYRSAMSKSHKAEYLCEFCDSKISGRPDLLSHMHLEHPEHTLSSDDLTHMRIDKGKSPVETSFECRVCMRVFKTSASLARHMLSHNVGEFVCRVCEKSYSTLSGLRTHTTLVHSLSAGHVQAIARARRVRTNRARYGVDYLLESPSFRKILSQKFVDKYGVPTPFMSDLVRDKIVATNMCRYGVPNPLANEEVRAKAYRTIIERYGGRGGYQSEEQKAHASDVLRLWWSRMSTDDKFDFCKSRASGTRVSIETSKGGKIVVRSLYEKRAAELLDECQKCRSFEYEPFGIEYIFDGVRHVYTPDFLVHTDGGADVVVEVKPNFRMHDDKVVAKANAASRWCEDHGMIYRFATEDVLFGHDAIDDMLS